jgi:hypothetical protein
LLPDLVNIQEILLIQRKTKTARTKLSQAIFPAIKLAQNYPIPDEVIIEGFFMKLISFKNVAFHTRTLLMLAIIVFTSTSGLNAAQDNGTPPSNSFSEQEMISAGHKFFGKTSSGFALAIESVFSKLGRPTAYIIGEEASGAVVAGLRYGEGTLHFKNGGAHKVYWQGPSVGFDFGGNASRTMTLVYKLDRIDALYRSYAGVEGSAYLVGGFSVNLQERDGIVLAPIRTGVGARLGLNFGYLKYTRQPTWNPF